MDDLSTLREAYDVATARSSIDPEAIEDQVGAGDLLIAALEADVERLQAELHATDVARLRAEAETERLRKGLVAGGDLIANSEGVAGLHMNGGIAPWGTLLAGGQYEEWLRDLSAARRHEATRHDPDRRSGHDSPPGRLLDMILSLPPAPTPALE